jgi:hypothetical protein
MQQAVLTLFCTLYNMYVPLGCQGMSGYVGHAPFWRYGGLYRLLQLLILILLYAATATAAVAVACHTAASQPVREGKSLQTEAHVASGVQRSQQLT